MDITSKYEHAKSDFVKFKSDGEIKIKELRDLKSKYLTFKDDPTLQYLTFAESISIYFCDFFKVLFGSFGILALISSFAFSQQLESGDSEGIVQMVIIAPIVITSIFAIYNLSLFLRVRNKKTIEKYKEICEFIYEINRNITCLNDRIHSISEYLKSIHSPLIHYESMYYSNYPFDSQYETFAEHTLDNFQYRINRFYETYDVLKDEIINNKYKHLK